MTRRRLALALVVLACFGHAPPAHAGGAAEVDACMRILEFSRDPVERTAAVRRLAKVDAASVPARLARIVRLDDDPGLRIEAAAAFATVPHESATNELLSLIATGGTRDVRAAFGRAVAGRGVAIGRIVDAMNTRGLDLFSRERFAEVLGACGTPLAAGQLELLARTGDPDLVVVALQALAAHPDGPAALPDVVFDVLRVADDVDVQVTALGLAERFGDGRLSTLDARLRESKHPAVHGALDVALAHIGARAARAQRDPSALDPLSAPRVRDRVDRLHVFHQGMDMAKIWGQMVEDLRQARTRWEDVRVGIVAYMEPIPSVPTTTLRVLPFTRDEAKIRAFMQELRSQVTDPTGRVIGRALEHGLDRASWRWDATERTVLLHVDAIPRDVKRGQRAAACHFDLDGTRVRVFLVGNDFRRDVPKPLAELAKAGGAFPVTLPVPDPRAPIPGVR